MTAGVSVILCCHNSAARLPETLRHLASQEIPADLAWEVLVIDNRSTDNTSELAKTEWQKYDLPNVAFRVLSESRPRKYYALATGVDHANYEYIVICDDDNWLNADYIKTAWYTINSNQKLAAVGGQGIPVTDGKIPDWFWQYQHIYAVGKPNVTSGDISAKGYLWGAGMIFRKALYQKVNHGIPSLLLGPNQTETARAEDVELCMRFLLAGYRLYYDEKLIFRHYIDANRLTDNYREGLLNIGDHETRVLNLYRRQISINNLSAIKKSLLLLASWLRYFTSKIFSRNKKWHYAYEAETIYLLSGLKQSLVSNEVIKIKQLNFKKAPVA